MKNIIFFILFVILTTPLTLFSQTGKLQRHDSKTVSAGFKVGPSIATLSGDIKDAVNKIGYTVGALGMLRLSPDIGISAEVLYSQQGCNISNMLSDSAGYVLNYINVPLMANWYTPWAEGLVIKGGVQAGFLLSSDIKLNGVSVSTDNTFKSIDISIPIGISYELAFGFLLEVRYSIGVMDVINANEELYIPAKNSVYQVTVGYRF